MSEEIQSKLNSGNASYYSVPYLSYSCSLFKNTDINIFRTINLMFLVFHAVDRPTYEHVYNQIIALLFELKNYVYIFRLLSVDILWE
jgi:hypothetical protein